MQLGTSKEESMDANHHKVRQEMSCLCELEEFLHASSLQTSAKNMICQLFSPKNQKKLSSVNSFHLYVISHAKQLLTTQLPTPISTSIIEIIDTELSHKLILRHEG